MAWTALANLEIDAYKHHFEEFHEEKPYRYLIDRGTPAMRIKPSLNGLIKELKASSCLNVNQTNCKWSNHRTGGIFVPQCELNKL